MLKPFYWKKRGGEKCPSTLAFRIYLSPFTVKLHEKVVYPCAPIFLIDC